MKRSRSFMPKAFYTICFVPYMFAILLLSGCDKEKSYTRADFIGEWILEKEHADTIYDIGTGKDSTAIRGNRKLIITRSDTAYLTDLAGGNKSGHIISFKAPNTLLFEICPVGFCCIYGGTIPYNIAELDNHNLILREEVNMRDKKVWVYSYYKK